MGKNNTLGNRIKHRRQILNLSQLELSKRLNCTQAALSQYENGNREPSLKDLSNIAKNLQTTTDYLLGLTDIASRDETVKVIGDYLGFTEESIEKLHKNYANVKAKTDETVLMKDAHFLSGRNPGEDGYENDYCSVRSDAFLELSDYLKIINQFICSEEFNVFISSMKHNLYLERSTYDLFRILMKQYSKIESPYLSYDLLEELHAYVADNEDNIKYYSLNLFDAQNALTDFCRNFTTMEDIKKLEYSESLYKKVHFYLYMCTKPREENDKDYAEEEKAWLPIIEQYLPAITDLLNKK